MTLDLASLKEWYRGAMARRVAELEELRSRISVGEGDGGYDAVRSVAEALRGSGSTFGFPEVTVAAGFAETADDEHLLRRLEGLLGVLRGVCEGPGTEGRTHTEWLSRAAGLEESPVASDEPSDLDAAWERVGRAGGLDPDDVAERVADRFGLETADLEAIDPSVLRLVPEALMLEETILPLQEDSQTITVATGDPTSLSTELELQQITGRRPVFVVAPPVSIRTALEAVLGQRQADKVVARPRAVEPERSPATVLIVEDDPEARLLARTLLERDGYEVLEAEDGLAGVEALERNRRVDLVLVDLEMPRMDGLEFIWEVRAGARWKQLPMIVVTADTDEILEVNLLEEGADDYIRKPLDPPLFLARVEATLRRAES